ncbi:MAG: 50S ribosomal protein L25, partial [Candidatus Omnitrophica bacterium]|nr:50S ribosomal protein L25 [Candidatus Omnitrophota bacterium]
RISLTEVIEVTVPIEAKGEADGVKNDGGSLDHAMWELDIICLPMNIPEKIQIDVTSLKIGDAIHVKDIVLPEGVTTEHDLESIVLAVLPPMKEEDETEGEESVSLEPEVIKEKKAKEEAEGSKEEKTEK